MEVGKKYRFYTGKSAYTVIWADEKGVLVEWTSAHGLGILRAWIRKEDYKNYEEISEPRTAKNRWHYVFEVFGTKQICISTMSFVNKKEAEEYVDTTVSAPIIDYVEVKYTEPKK